jgi:hypothetical protein
MRSKLTYSNVTATLALFLALGGSSYAAIKVTGKNVVDSSLTTKDIKNSSLLKGDFKAGQIPAGAQGPKGDQGIQGIQGQKGDNGSPGTPGSALAYATVDSDGTLQAAPATKNVDRATKEDAGGPVDGSYCLHATVSPANVVASLNGTDATGGEVRAAVVNNITCTAGAETYNVTVKTFNGQTSVLEDRAFSVLIN